MSFGTVQAEKMTTESGYSLGAGNASSFKNRIINGAMVIDQRNAGAVVTPTDNQYTLDRWSQRVSGSGVYTVQQSTTVPTGQGFINSIKATVTTADSSIAAGDIYSFLYKFEGYNTSDLMWGTANAKQVTLSFWVRSSQTGTYSVGFVNIDANRGYAATYTIDAVDTWEKKTITITGDTTGTWNTNNLCSIQISFCLACGTDRTEPAGSWSANNVQGADGTFNWMANSGATFYMTGVQFEVGTVATSFDFRDFNRELLMCMRYYEKSQRYSTKPASGSTATSYADSDIGVWQTLNPHRNYNPSGGYNRYTVVPFQVQKRSDFPTVTMLGGSTGNLYSNQNGSGAWVTNYGATANMNGFQPQNEFYSSNPMCLLFMAWYADAEL